MISVPGGESKVGEEWWGKGREGKEGEKNGGGEKGREGKRGGEEGGEERREGEKEGERKGERGKKRGENKGLGACTKSTLSQKFVFSIFALSVQKFELK